MEDYAQRRSGVMHEWLGWNSPSDADGITADREKVMSNPVTNRRWLNRTATAVGQFLLRRYNPDRIFVPESFGAQQAFVQMLSLQRRLDAAAAGSSSTSTGDEFGAVENELFLATAKAVIGDGRTLLKEDRLYVLWQAARNVCRMRLPVAEIGSYRGGSAYFLASAFKTLTGEELPLHVIDTFEGHPAKVSTIADPFHKQGMFGDTDYEAVKSYLSPFSRLQIHQGEFSEAARSLPEMTFGLVHIDVDIYQSTVDCLEYFGARLAPGGVMVVDDYGAPKCQGVYQAVTEFLKQEIKFQGWHMRTEQIVLVRVA